MNESPLPWFSLPDLEKACALQRRQLGLQDAPQERVLDAASVGATNILWRNSPVEDWHAAPDGLSDAEMMRANAAMTRQVRELLRPHGTDWLAVADAVSDKSWQLPDGRSLGSYARRRLGSLRRHAREQAELFLDLGQAQAGLDVDFAILKTALSGSRWWGMPQWPVLVGTFCAAIESPRHPHWRAGLSLAGLAGRPDQIQDTGRLRELLLRGPDLLDAESARWCVNALIGYVQVER